MKPEYEADGDPETITRAHDLECFVTALHCLIDQHTKPSARFVVRISGYSALGKSTLANRLAAHVPSVVIIPTDSFMLDREERRRLGLSNGDDPKIIDFLGLLHAVDQLRSGESIEIPLYDHRTGMHDRKKLLLPADIIIVEGACALYDEVRIYGPMMSVFLDADDGTKIKLRHDVNVGERGYTEEQFWAAVPGYLTAYQRFIQPSVANADYVCVVNDERRYVFQYIARCVCPGFE